MLKKYLRSDKMFKPKEEGDRPDLQLVVKRIKDRISVAEPYSPIVVFEEDGMFYEFFARTVKSKTMISDTSLNRVGIFHKDMPDSLISGKLAIH